MKRSPKYILLICPVIFLSFLQDVRAQLNSSRNHPSCLCIPASISVQPVSPYPVCPGSGEVSMTVSVSGTGPFSYRWKENGVFISDGGVYSGAHTATLTITNPPDSLNGKYYQCIVTNCMNRTICTDNTAMLTIRTLVGDINVDGVTDNTDFSMLNQVYNTSCQNCPEDIIPDGVIDVKDFLELLGYFNASCQ